MSRFVLALALFALVIPVTTSAFPFGGRITVHHVCYNETIFARLSPPVPGDYVWTRATKTYQFGPPRNVGQWLLGLTSMPYDCLWSVNPIYVQPAIAIMMMGSSGAAAPTYVPPPLQAPPVVSYTPAPKAAKAPTPKKAEDAKAPDAQIINPEVQLGKVVISEVYYDVDAAHGNDPKHEWIELYNGSENAINIGGWTIQNGAASDKIPSGTSIGAGRYLVIAAESSFLNYWTIPTGVKIVSLDGTIGNGLINSGDVVRIRNSANTIVDSVSWGTNKSALDPPVPAVPDGYSIARKNPKTDTNTATDWAGRSPPTPGK